VATQHGGQPVPDEATYVRAAQLLADKGPGALSPEERQYFGESLITNSGH
jgi:hypothetical protein